MLKRENFPEQRKYTTISTLSATTPSSLEKATDILMCLANGISSATEIAAYCNYSISTVHRLLQNLVELEWVVQDEMSHKYFLGSLVTKLASNALAAHRYLVLHALKEMSRISNLTEETVILGALDRLHYLKLHDIPSLHNLRIIEASDRFKGQYVGATAKVLLSQLADKELKTLLKHIKNEPLTPDSVIDSDTIWKQIQEIRQKGYAVSCGERIKGAMCISAPVRNYCCPLALYIVGPEDRLKPNLDSYIKAIIGSADLISEDIRGVFPVQGGIG